MSFIGIQLEGDQEFLDTLENTVISLNLENPIFGDAERLSPGSYSLPFNLPGGSKSPANSVKLKNPDVISNNDYYSFQKAKLFVGGVPFKSGNIKAKSIADDIINSYFTFGLNSLSEDFKKKKLTDIINGLISVPGANIVKQVFVSRTGTTGNEDWSIKVNSIAYEGEHLAIVQGKLNNSKFSVVDTGQVVPIMDITSTNHATIYLGTWSSGTDIFGNPIIIPSPVLDPTAGELSVLVPDTGEYTITADTASLNTYYNAFDTFLANYPNDMLCFPVMFNANPYGSAGLKRTEIINATDSAGNIIRNNPAREIPNWSSSLTFQTDDSDDGQYCFHYDTIGRRRLWSTITDNNTNNEPPTNPNSTSNANWRLIVFEEAVVVSNVNSLQPVMFLSYVMDQIADHFGFEWEGDFFDDSDYADKLIDNSFALDVPMRYINDYDFIWWRSSFDKKELVPDLSVVDFLKALQSRYNLGIYFNESSKKVRIVYRENIARSLTYEDITNKASPLSDIENERDSGYILRVPKDESDAFSFEESVQSGSKPDREYEIKCGRLHQNHSAVLDGETYQGVRVSRLFGSDFSFRLFHFKTANNGSFDYHSSAISGSNLNEALVGVNTLITVRWFLWLFFESNRVSVKTTVSYMLRELLNYDWELKRRFDRTNFLVKSIQVQISNRGVRSATVELYTMK